MKSVIFGLGVAFALNGCAVVGTRNGVGLIYTDAQDSITATDGANASKTGQACANNILGIVSQGNMTIDAAKRAGNIKKVASVDYSQKSILGIYSTSCTIVHGE